MPELLELCAFSLVSRPAFLLALAAVLLGSQTCRQGGRILRFALFSVSVFSPSPPLAPLDGDCLARVFVLSLLHNLAVESKPNLSFGQPLQMKASPNQQDPAHRSLDLLILVACWKEQRWVLCLELQTTRRSLARVLGTALLSVGAVYR